MAHTKTTPSRTERDSLGEHQVPASAYYGVQTSRAVENFPISGIRHHGVFIDAFMHLKKAAALANQEAGGLEPPCAQAIVQAADEVLSGQWRDEFVVDVYQMGAGTAFHMNCNEVLANRAGEILGDALGSYRQVHPNDHVNMGQSTNDAFPSAMRLATLLQVRNHFRPSLTDLAASFERKGREFDQILKSARTHLQDAVPIRLGQEFLAYALALRRSAAFFEPAEHSLSELGIGGSAAGTGLNTTAGYAEAVVGYLREFTGLELRVAEDFREAMQSQRPMAEVSAALRNLALEVTRISNDLRLLSSGPTTGLAEIALPSVAPGSSIMPGKVNPSIPEMVNLVCFQVIGLDTTVALAVQAGQLELNVMMPVMAYSVLQGLHIFGNALAQLQTLCVDGITADAERCQRFAEGSMGIAAALNPHIGYDNAGDVAKEALKSGRTIVDIVRERQLLTEEELQRVLDPTKMTEPGIPGQ